MKTTRYTTTSKKVIAIALALVLLATVFTGCNRTKEDETTTTTTTEVQTTIEVVTEIVTDEDGETVTNENGEAVTTEVTKVVEVTSQSEVETTSNKITTTTSTTRQTETTTKKNTSTGNSTTTTKVAQVTCSHKWGEWLWSDAKDSMISTCSKCGAIMTPDDCNHTYGDWQYRSDSKYHKCTKCPYSETIEGDFTAQCMGAKAEYLELLGYVNQARREAGLNELVYLDEFQSGANTRAKELTQKYSHTRPNGNKFYTAYANDDVVYSLMNENIVSGASTAKMAFGAWMNSEGHKANILVEYGEYFVCAKCDDKWVMSIAFKI